MFCKTAHITQSAPLHHIRPQNIYPAIVRGTQVSCRKHNIMGTSNAHPMTDVYLVPSNPQDARADYSTSIIGCPRLPAAGQQMRTSSVVPRLQGSTNLCTRAGNFPILVLEKLHEIVSSPRSHGNRCKGAGRLECGILAKIAWYHTPNSFLFARFRLDFLTSELFSSPFSHSRGIVSVCCLLALPLFWFIHLHRERSNQYEDISSIFSGGGSSGCQWPEQWRYITASLSFSLDARG